MAPAGAASCDRVCVIPHAPAVTGVAVAVITLAKHRERGQKALEQAVRERVAGLPGVKVSYPSSEPGEQS